MKKIEDLFKDTGLETEPIELSARQRVARAAMIEGLIRTKAFAILDERVSEMVSYSTAKMATVDDQRDFHRLQGTIKGVNALRQAVADFLEDGKLAEEELRSGPSSDEDGSESPASAGGQPIPGTDRLRPRVG